MKKRSKAIFLIIMMIILFPVVFTLVMSKINGHGNAHRSKSGRSVVVNENGYEIEMDLENFLPCVLMAEMPVDSPKELLKAQCVVLRTYIIKKMGKKQTITLKELGLPYISYHQLKKEWFQSYKLEYLYGIRGIFANLTGIGETSVFEENLSYLERLVQKTKGMVLTKNGNLILPLFHEMSNGTTRSGIENLGEDYHYLKSVACKTDLQQQNFVGTKYFTPETFKSRLAERGIVAYKNKKELFAGNKIDLQELLQLIDCSNKDQAGYVISVKIGDTRIEGETFADALGLESTAMEIGAYENGVRITTRGRGHGFGLSLTRAKVLAGQGADWQTILKTFYDVTIDLIE